MRTENKLPKVHAAVDRLMHLPNDELLGMCMESHKDFYGIKGRWMQGMANSELVSWWLDHFHFAEGLEMWINIEPFVDESIPGQAWVDNEMEDRLESMGFEEIR